MTQAQHTPTPWRICGVTHHGVLTAAIVQDDVIRKHLMYLEEAPGLGEEGSENAAFILRAVNCHDNLLAALQEIASWDFVQTKLEKRAVEIARTALAKAEGK